jgi:hypothetical protein
MINLLKTLKENRILLRKRSITLAQLIILNAIVSNVMAKTSSICARKHHPMAAKNTPHNWWT